MDVQVEGFIWVQCLGFGGCRASAGRVWARRFSPLYWLANSSVGCTAVEGLIQFTVVFDVLQQYTVIVPRDVAKQQS